MIDFKDPGLPSQNPTRSVWLDQNPLKNFRTTPNLPQFSDIVVIGSGLSGTSIAYHLVVDENTKLKGNALTGNQTNPTVTLLEAREACGGATGRNGGHIIPDNHRGFLLDSQIYSGRAMEAAAVRIFEQIGMNEIVQLVKDLNIECELRTSGNIEVYTTEAEYNEALESIKQSKNWGISPLKILSKEEMKRMLGTDEYVGAIQIPAGQLYPARIVWHLLRLSINKGLKFYTHTPVSKVRPATPDEIASLKASSIQISQNEPIWCVESLQGEKILTRDVAHATNAYAAHLLPQFRSKVFPVRAQIISTNGKNTPKLWPYGLSLRDGLEYAMKRDYPNGRLIYGGFRTASDTLEVDNANDAEINPKLSAALRESLKSEVFASMHNKPSTYHDVREWTGIMGFSDDDAPYVGQLYNKDGTPVSGQWTLVGLSAHGMPRCFRCGREVARRVSEKYMSSSEISARKANQGKSVSPQQFSARLLSLARFPNNPEKIVFPSTWAGNGANNLDEWDFPLPKSFISTPERFSSTHTLGWAHRTILPPKKSNL
ncbi:hypothetical protein BB560_000270 [Smittium megazygosporum]|uniref:FAD dependent oxidoreductase domain-containing protein n=1 Tax=Smittium megazygosporum TaxID=133381 RepID=A0A2T9ZKU0_9FUNG|nr:hypothetical protein BB560_000270 [Smittium megazygosporum]